MRKSISAAVAALLLAPVPALAASVHFVSGSTSAVVTSNPAGHLIVNAKVAGLGNGTHTWALSGSTISVTAGCMNNSGQFPNGTQKFSGTQLGYNATGTGNTTNGTITIYQDITPAIGSIGTCPSGQTWTVKSVSGKLTVSIDGGAWSGDITASK